MLLSFLALEGQKEGGTNALIPWITNLGDRGLVICRAGSESLDDRDVGRSVCTVY